MTTIMAKKKYKIYSILKSWFDVLNTEFIHNNNNNNNSSSSSSNNNNNNNNIYTG